MSLRIKRRAWQAITAAAVLCFLVLYMSMSYFSNAATFVPAAAQIEIQSSWDLDFNQTLEFQEIFVVSLPERTDRRDSMILAMALSDIKFKFIDAIHGDLVPDRAIPFGVGREMGNSNIGSWRAHMDAIHEVVSRNLTTALILEDDADWDVRLKEQLYEFAQSSRALIQPLAIDTSTYADSTYPIPSSAKSKPSRDIDFENLPRTVAPQDSVYGDEWEVLWLGHCGMNFPVKGLRGDGRADLIPKGRVVRLDDQTVPETQHLTAIYESDLFRQYPNNTRVVSHVGNGICSLAYAVTQASARRMLYHFAIANMTGPFDVMLHEFCDGIAGKGHHNCLTTHPGLFQHHRPAGLTAYDSDISHHGDNIREKPLSENLRCPVRINFESLLAGSNVYLDQFPNAVGE